MAAGAERCVDDRLARAHSEAGAAPRRQERGRDQLSVGKTFGNIFCAPFDLGDLATPGGAVPDLEVVVDSGDDDVAVELRVREERRRDEHTALAVGRRVGRAGQEVAAATAGLPGSAG